MADFTPHPLDAPDPDAPLVPVRMGPNSLPALRRVGYGLALVLVSVVATIGLSIAAVLMRFYLVYPMGWMNLLTAVNYIAIACMVVSFIGKTICLGAPKEVEGQTYLYTSFAYMLIAVGLSAVTLLPVTLPRLLGMVAQPAQLLSTIFFILFLRELAVFLEAPQLARRTMPLLIGSILAFGLLLGQLIITFQMFEKVNQPGMAMARGPSPISPWERIVLPALYLLYAVTVLYVSVKYALLLNKLRKLVRTCGEPAARGSGEE